MVPAFFELLEGEGDYKKGNSSVFSDLKYAAIAAAAIPAHAFVVGDSGIVAPGLGGAHQSRFSNGMRSFFMACAWAFMVAAGSLVYQHFLKKWEDNGFPILPVASLGVAGGNPLMGGAMPGGMQRPQQAPPGNNSGYLARPAPPGGQPKQTSFLEDYDC